MRGAEFSYGANGLMMGLPRSQEANDHQYIYTQYMGTTVTLLSRDLSCIPALKEINVGDDEGDEASCFMNGHGSHRTSI